MIDLSKFDTELVDQAIARSGDRFPDDVYGLMRVFMHMMMIMDERSGSAAVPDAEALIVDRLKVLINADERRLGELEEGAASIDGVSDTKN